ncbi:peptidoglycan editing factor PgeF [Vulgatibacter sp.]|uniref:peptidoglycan editing factor PgeF n=1 Tax=Vulgatibacter sp. TaxID=1971226 RepID=UPI003564CF02
MFLTSALLDRAGVIHGFTTREGGVSEAPWDALNLGGSVGDDPAAVEANLQRLAASAGIARERFRGAVQVHGDRVLLVEEGPWDPSNEGDALLATASGLAVAVKTADCVPILLFQPETGEAAAVHAGWRGTAAAIVRRAVEALASRGGDPGSTLAAIGPCIGRCCYEVSAELAADFGSRIGPGVVEGRRLDLAEANRLLLREAGLQEGAIDVLSRCTACEPVHFFSHRRDAGRTGRHLSFVAARDGRSLS